MKQLNFIIFKYISIEHGGKVYFLLLNSYVKFHAKICTHSCNINKNRRGSHPVGIKKIYNEQISSL